MNRPVFTMLVGLPGSGKSTYAASLGEGFVYLSTDALVEARAASLGLTYDDVWADYINEATHIMMGDLHAAIKDRRNIVWDRTNLTVKSRRRVLSQLPKEYVKVARSFHVPEEERQSRLSRRVGKTIPVEADERMRYQYVPPVLEEGFDVVEIDCMQEAA